MSMLREVVVGYEQVEPVIVANVAVGFNFILIGRHGTAKSTLARVLARGYGGKAVVYDATKDDILSICGIPKTSALEEGRFEFAVGERTIWDKKLIVIDELGRATKENQNILLEILQERTCFGHPLDYRVVIATMNPETYAASLRLDEALLDRFYAVVPVPDFQGTARWDTLWDVMDLHFTGSRDKISDADFTSAFQDIQTCYQTFRADRNLVEAAMGYTACLIEFAHKDRKAYISPRKVVQTAEEILAVAAYFHHIDQKDPLGKAADLVVRHTLALPCRMEIKDLMIQHRHCKDFLHQRAKDPKAEVLQAFHAAGTDPERIGVVLNNLSVISGMSEQEGNRLLGFVLDKAPDLPDGGLLLQELVKGLKGFPALWGEIRRKAEGSLHAVLMDRVKRIELQLKGKSGQIRSSRDLESMKHLRSLASSGGMEDPGIREFLLRKDFDAWVAGSSFREELAEVLSRGQ